MSEETIKEQKDVNQESTPRAVLLGSISYTDQSNYEKFLENLDVNQSIFVLIASATFAQSRGAFNLEESELIAKAIKTIKKVSANPAQESEKTEDSKSED
jgi:hypothetical protein